MTKPTKTWKPEKGRYILYPSLIIITLLLTGCETQSEANIRLIQEAKVCTDAGLVASPLVDMGGVIGYYQCKLTTQK